MEKRYYWLRLHDDFFTSKRIKKLRRLAGGDTYTIIYLKMQLLAIKKDGVLTFSGLENSFAEELALDLDENPDNVQVTLNYLMSCGLIETSDNIEFLLPYAVENTGSEGSSAERMRRLRGRKRDEKPSLCDNEVTETSQSDSGVTTMCAHRYGEKEINISNTNVLDRQTDGAVRRVIEAWNELQSIGIVPVSKISSGAKRYSNLMARIREYGEDKVIEAMDRIRESDFLRGKNKRGWAITFDWFVLPSNFPKVLDGNYKNSSGGNGFDFEWMDEK